MPNPAAGVQAPRRAAVAAVVVTVVLAVMTVGYTSLGQMACDSCTGSELTAFEGRYWTAVAVVVIGLALAGGLLVAGHLTRRRKSAMATVLIWLAPVVVAVAGGIAVALIHA
jgi:hypothetical protein